MSLLRLLTTGKSLVGLKKLEHRYQLPGGAALPRFGGKTNPFRATVFPEKPENSAPEQNAVAPEPNRVEQPAPEVAPEVAVPSQVPGSCSSQPVPAAAAPAPVAGSERRSPFRAFFLWGRAKRPTASHGLSGRSLVQAELSLDGVKVMRNDLSESDFEIVPARHPQAELTASRHEAGQGRVAAAEVGCVPELSKP